MASISLTENPRMAHDPHILDRMRKPMKEVEDIMITGEKFVRWEEETAGNFTHIPVTLSVDKLGSIFCYQEPSLDKTVLHIPYIRDVRTGDFGKVPSKPENRKTLEGMAPYGEQRLEDRTFTVVYGTDLTAVAQYHFMNISRSPAERAKKWTDDLFVWAYNIYNLNFSAHRSLQQSFNRIVASTDKSERLPVKFFVQNFSHASSKSSTNKEDRRRVEKALDAAGIPSGRGDFLDQKEFSFLQFFNFYKHLTGRNEVDKIFHHLFQTGGGTKKSRPYATLDQFADFLNNEQRDSRLNEILHPYYTKSDAFQLIERFEPNKNCVEKKMLSIDGFLAYLMSEENNIVPYEGLNICEMEKRLQPLSHYFINSSHNTYLTGHQLNGKSSIEIYRQALLAGCRCVELDCWNGTNDDEPIITHGYTFCSDVSFREVIVAIAESAFKTSEYPLILSFENHITIPKQQHKVVQYCKEYFGDHLLTDPLENYPLEKKVPLPPPELLKYKILIKNKKKSAKHEKPHDPEMSMKSTSVSSTTGNLLEETPPTSPTSPSADVRAAGAAVREDGVLKELSSADLPSSDGDTINALGDNDVVVVVDEAPSGEEHIHAVLTEKPSIVDSDTDDDDDDDEDEAIDDEKVKERGTAVEEAEPSQEISAMVNYVQPVRFITFDKAEKRDHHYECSSFAETEATRYLKEFPMEFVNYNKRQLSRVYPKGTRVDSSNYTPQMYWNAGCQLVALNFQTPDLGVMLNHGIFEYNGRTGYVLKPDFMRREDRRLDPFIESTIDGVVPCSISIKIISGQFLSNQKKDVSVEVDMFGLPTDTVRKRCKTSVVSGNCINPNWEEKAFAFEKVVLPQLAYLRISVSDENNKMLGHRVIPVGCVRPGYRHIQLRNELNQPVPLASLFVYIQVKDYVPDDRSDFANALMNPIKYQKDQLILKRTEQLRNCYPEEEEAEKKAAAGFLPEDACLQPPNIDLLSQRRRSDNGGDMPILMEVGGHAPVGNTRSSPSGLGNSDSSSLPSGALPITPPIADGFDREPPSTMDRQDSTSASEGLEDVDVVGPLQPASEMSRKGSKISSNCLKKANSISGGTSESETSESFSISNMSRQPSVSSSHNNNDKSVICAQRHSQLTHQQSTTSSVVSIDSCQGPAGSGGRIPGRHPSSTGSSSVASPDPKMDAFALFIKESSLNKRAWSPCNLDTIRADKQYEKLMAKHEKDLATQSRKSNKSMSKLQHTLETTSQNQEARMVKERAVLDKKLRKAKSKDDSARRQVEAEISDFNRTSDVRSHAMKVECDHVLHEKSLKHLEERESKLLGSFKEEFELLGILLTRDQESQFKELDALYRIDEVKLRKDLEMTRNDQVKELSKTYKDKQALARRLREVEQQFVTDIVSKIERLRDLKDKRVVEMKNSQEKVGEQLEALRLDRFTSLQKTIESDKQKLSERFGSSPRTRGSSSEEDRRRSGGGGGDRSLESWSTSVSSGIHRLRVSSTEYQNGNADDHHFMMQSRSSSGSTEGASSNGYHNSVCGLLAERDEATKL